MKRILISLIEGIASVFPLGFERQGHHWLAVACIVALMAFCYADGRFGWSVEKPHGR